MNPYLVGALVMGHRTTPIVGVGEQDDFVADPVVNPADDIIEDYGFTEQPENIIVPDGDHYSFGDDASLAGFAVLEWDNHHPYEIGEIVHHRGKHYRAREHVAPPPLPGLMRGDEPGKSDAWAEVSSHDVASQVLGAEDIAARQHQMNNLKPVTVSVAKVLLKYGQQAINKAITGAKQPWYRADLPGDTNRKNVQGKLQWHAAAIAALGNSDQNALYKSEADLRKWVMQAFIEENAVEEGNAQAAQMWSLAWSDWENMWVEVGVALAALPKQVLEAAGTYSRELVNTAVKSATGLPTWVITTGIIGGAFLIGLGLVKILSGPTGGAIVGTYLGHRR